MKQKVFLIILLIAIIGVSCNNNKLNYPETNKVDQVDEYFGVTVEDPYRWLEDDRSPETEAWVKAQNELTYSYLAEIPYREKIKDRLEQLWNFETMQSPVQVGEKLFYFKNNGLQNQDVLYIQENKDAEPEILIDPNALSENGTVAMSSNIAISNCGKYLAYQIAAGGSDWHEIYVMNLETKEILDDVVKWVKFSSIAWYKDGFFYSRYPEVKEGEELSAKNEFHRVCYHKLGTDFNEDDLISKKPL